MKILSTIALLLITTCSVFAQDDPEIWKGTLDVRVMQLRLELELNPAGAESPGKLISLDQGNSEMVFDELNRDGDSVSFSIGKAGVEFKGKMSADGKTIDGTFKQGGQSFPLKFVKGEKAKPSTHFQTWKGNMEAGGRKFDFQFRVFRDEDNNMTAKLDSFTERVFDLHCDVGHKGDGSVTIEIPVTKATYVGKFSADMTSINGKWKQAGGEFDLNLASIPLDETREPKAPERPQTPKGPFPYKNKLVTFDNEAAGIKLAGTLTLPQDSEKPPVVILITGSGPQDRDETIMDHKPFAVIADHLSRNGIAVFRYDERGVGASGGEFNGATSADLATDVEAAIDRMKSRKDVNPDQVILAGHSEGGLLAPMIAARRDDVAGIILLAPPGVNGAKIVLNQSRLIAEVSGTANQDELDKQEKLLGIAFEVLKADTAGTDEFYSQFKTKAAKVMGGKDSEDFELLPQIEVAVRQLDTPWFRFFATYEPVPALEKTKCPVLCLIGSKDLQVDPKLNLPPIRRALKDGGNKDFTVAEMEGMNHLFQECETGVPGEYGIIEQTISPIALNIMKDWIKKRFGN